MTEILHLGATFTAADGYWEIGPFSSAGPDGKRHLFVQLRMENAQRGLRVEHPDGNVYSWREPETGTIDVQLDGWKDFGNIPVPDTDANQPAVRVFMTLNQGWSYFPSNPGSVTAVWGSHYDPSCGMCYSPTTNKVLLARDAPRSPDTVLHEFAHNVMMNVYGSWPPNASGSHWFTRASGCKISMLLKRTLQSSSFKTLQNYLNFD